MLANEITVLRVPVIERLNLKSKNYWLMVLISKLPQLKVVKFHFDDSNSKT